jgi:hypothetical protein
MSASYYRRMANECRELAARMSLHRERERLLNMATEWARLAQAGNHDKAPPSLGVAEHTGGRD